MTEDDSFRKRPRSSTLTGANATPSPLSVYSFNGVVMAMPKDLVSHVHPDEIVAVFRNSEGSKTQTVISLRGELEECASMVRDEQKPRQKELLCSHLYQLTRDLAAALEQELKPATFDALWNAATSVFPHKEHKVATRFIKCSDLTTSEFCEPYTNGLIVPKPFDLQLGGRDTTVNLFPGESGVGKTATLMMGAHEANHRTYGRTLGMYFKASLFCYDEAVDEGALDIYDQETRDTSVVKYLYDLICNAMTLFFEKSKLNFDRKANTLVDRALVLCVDELGPRPHFVQVVINQHQTLARHVADGFGFSRCVVMLAGTGVDRAVLTPGSDFDKYVVHQLSLGDRALFHRVLENLCPRSAGCGTRSPGPIATVMKGEEPWRRFPELGGFVQNRRLSYYLAQALANVPETMQKLPSLGWFIRSAMLKAASRYRDTNRLKSLPLEETHVLFANVLCATMLGPSFHKALTFDSCDLKCCLRDDAVRRSSFVNGDVVIADHATGGVVIPTSASSGRRYHTTSSLQMALQLLVGGGLTSVEHGEEFEVHFASYAACCYLAVSRLARKWRTAATFLALLSQGSMRPLNPPYEKETLNGVTVNRVPSAKNWQPFRYQEGGYAPPEARNALSAALVDHILPQSGIQVVVLKTPLLRLVGGPRDDLCICEDLDDAIRADLNALGAASSNAVTVVMTARADSAADVVVVIHGLGMLPISCKRYEEDSTSSLSALSVAQELWKMGAAVEQSTLPFEVKKKTAAAFAELSEEYRLQMRNLGAACGLCDGALCILGFELVSVAEGIDDGGPTIKEAVPMNLAPTLGEGVGGSTTAKKSTKATNKQKVVMCAAPGALSPVVPVKYFACGSSFENTFPLQRFSPIERETFEIFGRRQ